MRSTVIACGHSINSGDLLMSKLEGEPVSHRSPDFPSPGQRGVERDAKPPVIQAIYCRRRDERLSRTLVTLHICRRHRFLHDGDVSTDRGDRHAQDNFCRDPVCLAFRADHVSARFRRCANAPLRRTVGGARVREPAHDLSATRTDPRPLGRSPRTSADSIGIAVSAADVGRREQRLFYQISQHR